MRKSKLYQKSPIICEPSDSMSRLSYIVGWVSRALVHFACVLGSSLFIADSFGITSNSVVENRASMGLVVLICLIVSALTSVASFNKKALIITPIVSVGAFFGLLCIWGNPVTLIWDGIRAVWNCGIHRLGESGYISFASYILSPDSYSVDFSVALNIGMVAVCTLFAVIFGLCLIRKGKMLPTAIVCCVLLIPIFTYNLTRTNVGMTCAVVFMVSALAICFYDRRYSGKEFAFIERRAKRKANKIAKRRAKIEKKQKKIILKKRAKVAYETALALSDDKKVANEAKKAVFYLEEKEKKDKKAALREEKAEAKKAAKKLKKEQKAEAKKNKAEAKKKEKADKARAKKDKAFAKELADSRKADKKAKSAAKKAKSDAKKAEIHARNEHIRYNIAAGGFAGLCAVVLASLCVVLPASAVTGKFPVIPLINNPISEARAYITAYLSGDDIDLNDLDVYGQLSGMVPRTLSFEPLEFEGTQIFEVYTDSTKQLVLKSWSATDYDYENNTWVGATSEDVIAFRDKFSKSFNPDQLRTSFQEYVFPTSVQLVGDNAYMTFDKYGFYVENVNVRRINSASKIIFVPSVLNTNYGISTFNTLTPIEQKYSNFYDGIYSSRFFDRDVPYATPAFIANYKSADVGDGISDAQNYFDIAMKYTKYVDTAEETLRMKSTDGDTKISVTITDGVKLNLSKNDFSELYDMFEAELKEKDITYSGKSLVERYRNMSDEEREELSDYVELDEKYKKYVNETYTSYIGKTNVKELAEQILADNGITMKANRLGTENEFTDKNGKTVSDHDVIMTVINYLRNNYTYTLTPTAPETETADVLSSFLFETKDGYCTHFATAAAALLREYGFPTRFCEGYIAGNFTPVYSDICDSKYSTYVLDDNAHAWIEVYIDGFGWMQYETTPQYAAPMYDPDYEELEDEVQEEPNEEEDTPDTPAVPEEPEKVEPVIEPENVEEELDEGQRFNNILKEAVKVIVIILIVIALLRVGFEFLKRRAKKETDKRFTVVHTALEEERKLKTLASNRDLCIDLNDQIMNVLSIAGLAPDDGEGIAEYSERLEGYFGGMTEAKIYDIFSVMMNAEFGSEIEAGDLWIVADFLARLVPFVYSGLPLGKKLYYRYFKRKI